MAEVDMRMQHTQALQNVEAVCNEMAIALSQRTSRSHDEMLAVLEKNADAMNRLSDIEAKISGIPRLSPQGLETKVREMETEILNPLFLKMAKCMEDVNKFESGEDLQLECPLKELDGVSELLKQRGLEFSIIRKCTCQIDCEHSVVFCKTLNV